MKVGQPVAAIGSPFGNVNSLSVGVVSATERSIDSLTSQYSLVDAIQTDAAINHGNSGGPLFDARGRVIGINAQIRSDSGAAEGVGFAVPIDSARRSMTQLIAAGRVSYAYVGIETEDLIPSIATQLHYPVMHGAVVTRVNPHSPEQAWGVSDTQLRRYIAAADRLMKERFDAKADHLLNRQAQINLYLAHLLHNNVRETARLQVELQAVRHRLQVLEGGNADGPPIE